MRLPSSQRWASLLCHAWITQEVSLLARTPEEPQETWALGEDSWVSGCFHGLPRHVLVACWQEGRTATSFYLGHRPRLGTSFPHLCPVGHLVKHQLLSHCFVSSSSSMA